MIKLHGYVTRNRKNNSFVAQVPSLGVMVEDKSPKRAIAHAIEQAHVFAPIFQRYGKPLGITLKSDSPPASFDEFDAPTKEQIGTSPLFVIDIEEEAPRECTL